jgi:hypothetical protein
VHSDAVRASICVIITDPGPIPDDGARSVTVAADADGASTPTTTTPTAAATAIVTAREHRSTNDLPTSGS